MTTATITFADLALAEPIQKAVAATGYTVPTPIQAAAIPHLLKGRDLLGCAQTGTGKTAAFALPILDAIHRNRRAATPRAPRVLVLSPTRELATQIAESFRTYGKFVPGRQVVIYGGVGQRPQVEALARGVQIAVATPGRLLDLMQQGHVRLDELEIFVLDEADRMLDMGFLPDIRRIVSALPTERQSLFFSATMPSNISQLADSLLTDPVRVEVTPESSTVTAIEQQVMFMPQPEKRTALDNLLQDPQWQRVLVFTRTKRRADMVARQLRDSGVRADAIHGNKSQNARDRVLKSFRDGRMRVLVATDVAARGLDVDGITHVLNYDLPHEPECYVHRIGRTGRAGASGVAVSFCGPDERRMLRAIERTIGESVSGEPLEDDGPAPGASRAPRRRPTAKPVSRRPRRRASAVST